MATLLHQLKRLEKDADLVISIRDAAKTDGGRLTQLGKDLLHALVNNDFPQTEIAKLLDITPSAVSQHAGKIKNH
jgi:DNA-binding MarR family transcriptional regulator